MTPDNMGRQSWLRLWVRVSEGFGTLGVVFISASAVSAVVSVIMRYAVLHLGWPFPTNLLLELQWYLFGLASLFAAPYVLRIGRHVSIDLWTGRATDVQKRWNERWLVLPAVIVTSICVLVLSLGPAMDSIRVLEGSSNPGGLPRFPIRAAIPVSMVLLLLEAVSGYFRTEETE
jgi:TRAP-type mannitol/chloroaromatic compound transport system permease small subunit